MWNSYSQFAAWNVAVYAVSTFSILFKCPILYHQRLDYQLQHRIWLLDSSLKPGSVCFLPHILEWIESYKYLFFPPQKILDTTVLAKKDVFLFVTFFTAKPVSKQLRPCLHHQTSSGCSNLS